MRNIIIIPVIALLALCASCAGNDSIGQYVYVDGFCTIHIDRACASKLADNLKTQRERGFALRGVDFVDTCKLTYVGEDAYGKRLDYRFCPKCIHDEAYQRLSTIIKRNETKSPNDTHI